MTGRLLVVLALACVIPGEVRAQSEQVEYYALDALGSVRVVFNGSGAVVGRMDYAPFGEELFTGLFVPTERFAQLTREGRQKLRYRVNIRPEQVVISMES